MKKLFVGYYTLFLLIFLTLVDTAVVHAQDSETFQDISISDNLSGCYLVGGGRMPYVDENQPSPERAYPWFIYQDVVERYNTFLHTNYYVTKVKLIVWSDGTIVWRLGGDGESYSEKYHIGKIEKKKIEEIAAEITKKGEKYSSGEHRLIGIRFGTSSQFGMQMMLPNLLYEGYFNPMILKCYTEAKESVDKFSKEERKEERVAFVKKMTGYAPRTMGPGGFMVMYKYLLFKSEQPDAEKFVLSDDEIDVIAPYVFDDIDFYLFSRDTLLSLIPADDEGADATIKFSNTDDRNLIATEFYEDGKFRYEYHFGTHDEFMYRRGLFLKRRAE